MLQWLWQDRLRTLREEMLGVVEPNDSPPSQLSSKDVCHTARLQPIEKQVGGSQREYHLLGWIGVSSQKWIPKVGLKVESPTELRKEHGTHCVRATG